MLTPSRFFRRTLALLLGFIAGGMPAQSPEPGVAITNQARVDYRDAAGTLVSLRTNTVSATAGTARFTLTADRTQGVTAGSSVTLTANGFCANAVVVFTAGGVTLGQATANASGSASITIPGPPP